MNRRFGPRVCPKDQPQRSRIPKAGRNNLNHLHMGTRCGWCSAHSRAPFRNRFMTPMRVRSWRLKLSMIVMDGFILVPFLAPLPSS